jgi:hypothetical protein
MDDDEKHALIEEISKLLEDKPVKICAECLCAVLAILARMHLRSCPVSDFSQACAKTIEMYTKNLFEYSLPHTIQ